MANDLTVTRNRQRELPPPDDKPKADAPSARSRAVSAHETRARETAGSYADANGAALKQSYRGGEVSGVRPEQAPAQLVSLATEVLKQRAELAKLTDATARAASHARIAQLSSQWCQAAAAAGLKPPGPNFDPQRCSRDELQNALLWTEVGNCFPVGTFGHAINPENYRNDVLSAWVLQSPGMLDRVIAANPGDARLVPLLEADLRRLGDKNGCRPDDTIESLVARRSELLAKTAKETAVSDKQLYMGLDGRVGTADSLAKYEGQQYLLALNPGTTTGALLAAVALAEGGGVEEMRRAGATGNAVESLGSQAIKHRDAHGAMSNGKGESAQSTKPRTIDER